ncbi:MAG: LamG domain-containing protein [Prevotellaceae bacterium]|nr:LamG domain-containing protein [Prevotellaceae bacterium]
MKKLSLWLLAIVAGVSMTAVVSCGNDDDDNNNPDDGKIDPSTVAADNLIAYFPFEENGNDAVGGLTPSQPTTSGITYPTGRRGKAYQGADENYLKYVLPSSSKIKTLNAFTVSMWLKLVPTETGGPEQMIYQLDGTTDWIWGNFFLRQGRNNTGVDTAQMTHYLWKNDAADWKGQFAGDWHLTPITVWTHVICTYDNVASEFRVYRNGAEFTTKANGETFETKRWQGEAKTVPYGNLQFNEANNLVIGAWAARVAGELTDDWAGYFLGQLDEFRIYDRALTKDESNALFKAEATQINE